MGSLALSSGTPLVLSLRQQGCPIMIIKLIMSNHIIIEIIDDQIGLLFFPSYYAKGEMSLSGRFGAKRLKFYMLPKTFMLPTTCQNQSQHRDIFFLHAALMICHLSPGNCDQGVPLKLGIMWKQRTAHKYI